MSNNLQLTVFNRATLQWEWASYVVETTPAAPYNGRVTDLLEVEANMRQR